VLQSDVPTTVCVVSNEHLGKQPSTTVGGGDSVDNALNEALEDALEGTLDGTRMSGDQPITFAFNGPVTIEMNDDSLNGGMSISETLTEGAAAVSLTAVSLTAVANASPNDRVPSDRVASDRVAGDRVAGDDGVLPDEPNALVDELSDRLQALRALSHDSEGGEGADAILQEFGAKGKVEQDIVKELAALKPLFMPHRFEQAHYLVMRSLEVLDRNGARPAKLPRLGPLQPIASWLVQLIARFIVRNHQAEVITSVKNLYIRREANSPKNSPERFMLRRARIDAERCLPTLKKNPLGVPTFLLGGAFVSWISSALGSAIEHAKSKTGLLIAVLLLFILFAGASWAVLRGAAVARNRIKMSLDKPLHALWETIGAAGKPPKDSAKAFALIAIIITGLGFVLIPVAVAVAVFR
jgi:hypothetical protein